MASLIYPSVGKCIYCGSLDELTDEHIVPYGLGGDHTLPKASCKKCATTTSKSELEVLRGLWWLTRAVLNFPTRRPKDMPSSYSLKVETRDGVEKEITLERNEKFAMASFIEYAPPVYLAVGSPPHVGILITGHRLVGFGDSLEQLGKKYNFSSISGTVTYKGTNFARMLAKIAWGFAVGSFSLDNFESSYVTDCILNIKDDVGRWVGSDPTGTSPKLFQAERVSRHAISVHINENKDVHVRVRLFSFSPHSPAYLVVVGRLKSDTPQHAIAPTIHK